MKLDRKKLKDLGAKYDNFDIQDLSYAEDINTAEEALDFMQKNYPEIPVRLEDLSSESKPWSGMTKEQLDTFAAHNDMTDSDKAQYQAEERLKDLEEAKKARQREIESSQSWKDAWNERGNWKDSHMSLPARMLIATMMKIAPKTWEDYYIKTGESDTPNAYARAAIGGGLNAFEAYPIGPGKVMKLAQIGLNPVIRNGLEWYDSGANFDDIPSYMGQTAVDAGLNALMADPKAAMNLMKSGAGNFVGLGGKTLDKTFNDAIRYYDKSANDKWINDFKKRTGTSAERMQTDSRSGFWTHDPKLTDYAREQPLERVESDIAKLKEIDPNNIEAKLLEKRLENRYTPGQYIEDVESVIGHSNRIGVPNSIYGTKDKKAIEQELKTLNKEIAQNENLGRNAHDELKRAKNNEQLIGDDSEWLLDKNVRDKNEELKNLQKKKKYWKDLQRDNNISKASKATAIALKSNVPQAVVRTSLRKKHDNYVRDRADIEAMKNDPKLVSAWKAGFTPMDRKPFNLTEQEWNYMRQAYLEWKEEQ